MKKKINDLIEMLDLSELIKMKKDIDGGGGSLIRIVNDKIREELKKHDRFCCVCNTKLNPYSVSNFTLIFGPDGMKKTASFCAIDCMEYFISNLKDFWGVDNQAFIKNRKKSK